LFIVLADLIAKAGLIWLQQFSDMQLPLDQLGGIWEIVFWMTLPNRCQLS
jgi:hypothetical protein